MQISRHWRMNSQRYRLQGVRLENGQVSLQGRQQPQPNSEEQTQETPRALKQDAKASAA